MTIYEKIKKYMEVNNMKALTDFSQFVDVPYTTIKNLETKSNTNIKRETLIKLKNAMGITLDELADDNIDIDFENEKNKNYINGKTDVVENTVISIGRGGKRSVYTLNDSDIKLVNDFLCRLSKKIW